MTLQQQIFLDARYLQTLFKAGKHDAEVEARYNENLELLYLLDKEFLNAEPTDN